jgi:hypothetical protein
MLNNRNDPDGSLGGFRGGRRVAAILACCLIGGSHLAELRSQDSAPREKKVFVHHMGSMNAGMGAMAWHTRNPEMGNPASSNGGDYRTLPLVPYDLYNLTLEETADLQIRQAMRIGIDGFAVNAWAGGDDAKRFLDALFRVAEANDYPFEISICPDPSAIRQTTGLTDAIVDAVRYLLDRHGNSPKLARRDGKPIIFGYQSNFLWVHYLEKLYNYDQTKVDIARTTEEGWALVGDAYANLERMVGRELYIQFDMGAFYHGLQTRGIPANGHVRAAEVIARHLPAVNEFLPSAHTNEYARLVSAAGSEWGQPIYMNYDNPRINWSYGGPGTLELQRRWREARESDATLLQLTTWNDYHENTNIAPGTNNNYAYFDLTGYFIEWWKTGIQPQPTHDRVYVFSRKYPRGAKMYPFQDYGGTEGVIEVLTILSQPARIRVPGRGEYDAPVGLFHQHFPVTPGPVKAEVIRNGIVQLVVESPEPVSARPFRQDNGITGISSECAKHWRADFGDRPQEFYSEYGDLDGNGLPNWFVMHWFGHFGDFRTAVGIDPNADPNGDGYTNREAYLLQRSPVAPAGSQPHQAKPVERAPFAGSPWPIPGRIEAEFYDHGGPGVAYYDTTTTNQGGAFRPSEQVDLSATTDVGGGYNIGWTTAGEWLEYTVDVEAGGRYALHLRVASLENGGALRLLMNGEDVSGRISLPNTGGWQTWTTLTMPDVTLRAGPQTLRLEIVGGGFNLNNMDFEALEVAYPPVAEISLPGSGAIFNTGDEVEIVVTANSQGSGIAKVEFLGNGQTWGEVVEPPYQFVTAGLGAGEYSVVATATDINGLSVTTAPIRISIRQARAPYFASAHPLPGKIRAKDFDLGGQGVAYFDSTSSNEGGSYRTQEGVDLEATSDYTGGYNLGWTAPGEWILYTVDVKEAGTYDLHVRVAAVVDGTSLEIDFNQGERNLFTLPRTGGWQNWETVTRSGIYLERGLQTMRLTCGSSNFNINYVKAELISARGPDEGSEAITYAGWQERHFTAEELANDSITGDNVDLGGNGISNLLHYALNRDPRENQRDGLPKLSPLTVDEEEFLGLTFLRPSGIQDLIYQVEVSSDLLEWKAGEDHVVLVSVTPEGDAERVVFRDRQPLQSFGSRMLRLRVERIMGDPDSIL